jgi:protein-S-isoprenylcysteine O-methyltransferase Ste14
MTGPIFIAIAAILYSIVHSLLASLGAKARARQWFGPNTDRWYRLAYNLFGGISFLPILGLLAFLPDKFLYRIEMPRLLFTSLGQLLGAVIIVVGIWQTGAGSFLGLRQIWGTEDPSQNQELVVRGIYRWMRHPLYTGGILVIWFTPVMSVNLLTLFICLTIYLIVGARFEERRLIHEFGEAYKRYMRRVPMLIPRAPKKRRT